MTTRGIATEVGLVISNPRRRAGTVHVDLAVPMVADDPGQAVEHAVIGIGGEMTAGGCAAALDSVAGGALIVQRHGCHVGMIDQSAAQSRHPGLGSNPIGGIAVTSAAIEVEQRGVGMALQATAAR